MINVRVIPRNTRVSEQHRNVAYLEVDDWDDFSFKTSFFLHYVDSFGIKHEIGLIKIGVRGQKEHERTSSLIPQYFEKLEERFFSLGQGVDFYEKVYTLKDEGKAILNALNDLVLNQARIVEIQDEEVFNTSLLREMSLGVVEQQFGRAVVGKIPLSNFHFKFSRTQSDYYGAIDLDFKVIRDSNPPSNIHAIIGTNGSGKTTILNGMVSAIIDDRAELGEFYDVELFESKISRNYFGRIVSVAFSAFDPFSPPQDRNDPAKGPCYTYIGLKNRDHNGRNYHVEELHRDCVSSLLDCFFDFETNDTGKTDRWHKAIEKLSSDDIFADMNLHSMFDIFQSLKFELGKLSSHTEKQEYFYQSLKHFFDSMSTGHAIVFITITRLVATVELKTLVLLDEPESHLHPPLLSSFIRALSDLMVSQNAVAILATHSPVVLQEIPRSCVSIIDRSGMQTAVNEPRFETFAENIGLLTYDVFSLQLRNSGFYAIFNELIRQGMDYEQIIEAFGDNIGMEGRSILLSMISGKMEGQEND